MKCFEVVADCLFMCFATGKMQVYNKATQSLVRKSISAHGSEIKFIARGRHPTVYTACVDNQVRGAYCAKATVLDEAINLAPL
jgi:hypothetical protein